jgi:hypothetical protein
MAGPWSYDLTILVTDGELVVAGATHALTSNTVALAQGNNLGIGSASHSLTSGEVALTQNDLSMGPWSYDLTVIQGNVPLTTNSASHTLTSDTPALTQWEVLEAAHAAATYSDTAVTYGDYVYRVTDADGAVLTSNTAEFRGVVIADSNHALTSDTVTLITAPPLDVDDATHALSSDTARLMQKHSLIVDDAVHGLSSDTVSLTQFALELIVSNAAHALTSDTVALTQSQTLAVSDALHALTSGNVTLGYAGAKLLVISDATHSHSASVVTLIQNHDLVINGAEHELTSTHIPALAGIWQERTAYSALWRERYGNDNWVTTGWVSEQLVDPARRVSWTRRR